ncbi:MAG: aminotransferase class I/II-fold pyridoxal phosphate-dependent enzyme [Chthoniobacteraceae bacterium]
MPSTPNLADFYVGDDPNPLIPPPEFAQWRREYSWAGALFEPKLLGASDTRVRLGFEGREMEAINLCSSNYLGLARHPEVIAAAQRTLAEFGVGACGSPILSGVTELQRQLEARICQFLGREATLIFNSGFGGAMGSIAGVLRRADAAMLDEYAHFSLLDGALLAGAKLERFKHNDPDALDAALRKHDGRRRLVVLDGVYSMDGDMADLPALCTIAESHGAGVLVDEAHSVLTVGANGRGVCEHHGVEARAGLYVGTFSKAFAAIGGFVSGSAETIDYLRFYAHTYGFSCTLPPATIAGLIAALDVATRDGTLRRRLADNASYFRTELQRMGLDTGGSNSHTIPIILGDNRPLLYVGAIEMRRRGLLLAAVDFPAVPERRLRFRASITAAHTRADLDEALDIIRDVVARGLGTV